MSSKKKHSSVDTVATAFCNDYKGIIRRIGSFNKHIAELTETRNAMIAVAKNRFGKTDENIEFELKKLRTGG